MNEYVHLTRHSPANMTTQEAVNTFVDNIDEILIAVSSNMQDKVKELESTHNEVMSILTTDREKELAREVHILCVQQQTEDLTHSLKVLARKKQSLVSPLNPNRITDNDIARAKEYPIQNLYTGKLRKATGKFAWCGKCELHNDSTASFYIDKKNNYHCFGCGAHGDAISYYMRTTGEKNFIQAVKKLI
jgi:hypothetical protein